MPTIEQIRAARALLDWSQSDLADHSGLSQTGVARIENGTNKPNLNTIEKIETAFELADIEFLGTTGVRKKTSEVKTLEGKEGFRRFMDDVYQTAKTTGGDICLFNGKPSLFYKWLDESWYEEHSERMSKEKDNFNLRIIIEEEDKLQIASDFAEYRWFPKELFNERTLYAYGNKIAFMIFEDNNILIRMIENKEFAESFKVLFDIAWKNVAKKP